jgi:hypothetical protein
MTVSNGVRMGSGRLIGGAGNLFIGGGLTQTGGIISNVQGTLSLSGSLSVKGTNSNNPTRFTATGTLVASDYATQYLTFGASNVRRQLGSLTMARNHHVVASGSSLNLSGALTVNGGGYLDLSTESKALVVRRGITIAASGTGALVTNSNVTASGSISVGTNGQFDMSAGTLQLNGNYQQVNLNGETIPTLRVSTTSGAYLTGNVTVSTALTVDASSTLSLGSKTLTTTNATITNAGLVRLQTGVHYHPSASFYIADSTYAEDADTSLGTVYFTISDENRNLDGTTAETFTITVSLANGDSETVTLTESAVASGIFRGSISVIRNIVTAGDGILEALASSTMTASYTDSDDSQTDSDTATLTVASLSSTNQQTGGGGGGRSRVLSTATPVVAPSTPTTPTVRTPSTGGPTLTLQQRVELRRQARTAMLSRAAERAAARRAKWGR